MSDHLDRASFKKPNRGCGDDLASKYSPSKEEDLTLIPSTHMKRFGRVGLKSYTLGVRNGRVPGAGQPV